MKKTFFTVLCVLVVGLTACMSDEPSGINVGLMTDTADVEPVTISFACPEVTIEPMTRASISESASRLDVWIYESGSELTAVHQSSSDVGFGSMSLNLNKTKTYTIYAIAHKAAAACTLIDGIISFPDDKPKESFFYTTTFSPASTNSINAEMKRICGKFTMTTTDAVPAEVDHVQFIIKNTALRYGVDGTLANITDRVVDFANLTRKNDGTISFSFNILSTSDVATNFEIITTAYASDNSVVETKTFSSIPIRNNYRTTLSGAFFTSSSMSVTFTTSDWSDYGTISF